MLLVTQYRGADFERYHSLFSLAKGTSALIWEASLLLHTEHENIKTKLFITALSKLMVFASISRVTRNESLEVHYLI